MPCPSAILGLSSHLTPIPETAYGCLSLPSLLPAIPTPTEEA